MYSPLLRSILVAICLLFVRTYQQTCPAKLVTSLHQKNCTDKSTETDAFYLDRSDCIPKCKTYSPDVQPDIDCSKNENVCITGYQCESRCGAAALLRKYPCNTDTDCRVLPEPGAKRSFCRKYCVPIQEETGVTCMAYHSNLPAYVQTYWTALKFKPICDDDGKWLAKQCKGGLNGRCMCYSATGERLFGQAMYQKSQNMTCACSRRKSDLESAGRSYVTLHCDSLGNYEPLQCDMEKELCWCVEPLTGKLTAPFVPEVAKIKLPCFEASKLGSQYLRQCESKKFAQSLINAKLKTHGVTYVQSDNLLCDADGSYGAYKVTLGIAYCTWRDNSAITPWSYNLANLKEKLTCNCARDFKLYEHNMDCESYGNYVTKQTFKNETGGTMYYCVDEDGFAKSDVTADQQIDCSTYY